MHFPIDFDGVEDHSLAAQPELRADLGSGASNLVGTDSARTSLFDRRADWILELEERLDNTTENFASSIEKIADSVASSVYDADEMQEALRDLALPSAWDEVFESLKNYAEELRIKVSFAIDVETFIVLDSDEFTVDGSLTLSLASSKLVRAGVGAKVRIHHIDDHTWATLPPRRSSNIEAHNGDPHKSNDVDFSSPLDVYEFFRELLVPLSSPGPGARELFTPLAIKQLLESWVSDKAAILAEENLTVAQSEMLLDPLAGHKVVTETAEQRINQRHYSKEKVGDFIELAFGEDARKSYYDMLPALEFEDADMKASMFIMSVRARGYSISNVDIAVALNILRYAGDRPAIETTISAEAQIPLQIIGDQFTFLTKPDVAGSFVIDYVDNPFSWLIPAAIRELEVRSEPGSPIRIAVTRIGDQHRHYVQKQNPPRRASRIHHA